MQFWKRAKQLGLKFLVDPLGADLLEVNEVLGCPTAVLMSEVDAYLTEFLNEGIDVAKAKVGSWVVKLKCGVTKQMVVNGCTEKQATENPYSYDCEDEIEIEQYDWEVTSVEPND